LAQWFGSVAAIRGDARRTRRRRGRRRDHRRLLLEWFEVDWHRDIVERWEAAGARLAIPGHPAPAPRWRQGVLEGITVVATGSLDGYTRRPKRPSRCGRQGGVERLEEDRLRRGGAGAGSKLTKAESLGIRIIDAAQFRPRRAGAGGTRGARPRRRLTQVSLRGV
jgi:DNA ligase (NAD+)